MEQARKWLQGMTPDQRPLMWSIINALCVAYSLILFYIALHYDKGTNVVKLADQTYLFYSFFTTIVWCMESTLNAFVGNQEDSMLLYFQFLLSVYFLGDSGFLLYQWKWKEQELEVVVLDTVVSGISYVAALVSTWELYQRRKGYDSSLLEQSERFN